MLPNNFIGAYYIHECSLFSEKFHFLLIYNMCYFHITIYVHQTPIPYSHSIVYEDSDPKYSECLVRVLSLDTSKSPSN